MTSLTQSNFKRILLAEATPYVRNKTFKSKTIFTPCELHLLVLVLLFFGNGCTRPTVSSFRSWMSKPSRYETSHPGQLSLAIPPWVGAVSISKSGTKTGTPCDALAPCPWFRSVN